MSRKILGKTFDIHGGGLDLVFPHHENELAQSRCCHGQPMVKYWMHNGLMRASSASGKVGGQSDREVSEPNVDDVAGKISRSKGGGRIGQADRTNKPANAFDFSCFAPTIARLRFLVMNPSLSRHFARSLLSIIPTLSTDNRTGCLFAGSQPTPREFSTSGDHQFGHCRDAAITRQLFGENG